MGSQLHIPNAAIELTAHEVRDVSVRAGSDPRTVRRVAKGETLRSSVIERRIRQAIASVVSERGGETPKGAA